jgi:hypothetical protein
MLKFYTSEKSAVSTTSCLTERTTKEASNSLRILASNKPHNLSNRIKARIILNFRKQIYAKLGVEKISGFAQLKSLFSQNFGFSHFAFLLICTL